MYESFVKHAENIIKSSFAEVPFNDEIKILTEQLLVEFSVLGATAYKITRLGEEDSFHYALVPNTNLPPRLDLIHKVKTMENGFIQSVQEVRKIPWTQEGLFLTVVLLQKPQGQPLLKKTDLSFEAFKTKDVEGFFVKPILSVLRDFEAFGYACGMINPHNFFWKNQGPSPLVLGECYMTPDSFAQPLIFQTIARGAADYYGRGESSLRDDIYAFGVTIIALIAGRIPLEDLSPAEIIHQKIEKGSFSLLSRAVSIPTSLNELLRGVLVDDDENRWTLDEIEEWFGGNRHNPKQIKLTHKAARYYNFEGRDYGELKTLALGLGMNPPAALKEVDNGSILNWLSRSFAEQEVYNEVYSLIEAPDIRKAGYVLISKLCMIFDQTLPVFYKSSAIMPEGIGPALMDSFIFGEHNPGIYAEVIVNRLFSYWISLQEAPSSELTIQAQNAELLFSYLEKKRPGFGLERILYEFNRNLYCLSPIVANHKPDSLVELLLVLEEIAKTIDIEQDPIDRHIIAFICSKQVQVEQFQLSQLDSSAPPESKALATLYLIAEVQKNNKINGLPGLAAWIYHRAKPIINRLHNLENRTALSNALDNQVRAGDLIGMHEILNNEDIFEADVKNFEYAVIEKEYLDQNVKYLKALIKKPDVLVQTVGRYVAAMCSIGLSLFLLVSVVMKMVYA